MQENSKYFVLAYSSPLLKHNTLKEIGMKGEKKSCRELIESGIMILGMSNEVAEFLKLLY